MLDSRTLQKVEAAAEIVTEPRDNDVMLGKGYRCREHCGTKNFHGIVKNHVDAYRSAKNATEKGTIAEDIVSSITTLDPPGRFLRELRSDEKRNTDEQSEKEDEAKAPSCCWAVLDNAVVLKKVKQALRDSIRTTHSKASSAAAAAVMDGGPRPLQPILPRPPSLPHGEQADLPSVKQLFQDLGVLTTMPVLSTPPRVMPPVAGSRGSGEKRIRGDEQQVSGNQTICLPSMFSPINSEKFHNRDEEEAANQLLALLMSNETQTPPFSQEAAQREQETMTKDEKVAALSDLFGNLCEVGPDTTSKRIKSDSIDTLLADMRRAVADIPQERKSALLLAMKRASPREFDNDRLKLFLNREAMDPTKAAERLAAYWEERRFTFGRDKYFLPLTLNGALRDDPVALEAGFMQLVPGLDESGRQIFFISIQKHTREGYNTMSAMRAIWYIYHAALEHPSAINGIVHLIDGQASSVFDIDMELDAMYSRFLTKACPVAVCSQHHCNFPVFVRRYAMPLWLFNAGKEIRARTLYHDCSETEVVGVLQGYGILPEVIPTELGGSCELSHSEWLSRRKRNGN